MTDSVSGPRRYTFSALGVDLILLIFRFAQFRDKIHAQKACKLWRSLLSCKARNGDSTLCLTPGLWADRLLIVVRPPDKYRSKAQVVSTGKSYNRDPSIQLTPKEGTLSGLNTFLQASICNLVADSLTAWTARVVPTSQPEDLHILSTLTSLTCLKFHDKPELLLEQTFSELGSLHQLHTLALTHTANFHLKTEHFCNLRSLELDATPDAYIDLSSCWQLTSLKLLGLDEENEHVTLPSGKHVALRLLEIQGTSKLLQTEDLVLLNLSHATNLGYLQIEGAKVSNFYDSGCPGSLPNLSKLVVGGMTSDLPIEWLTYSKLHELDLSGITTSLPDWFPDMTQLKVLNLHAGQCGFPECLWNMTQLYMLNVSEMQPQVSLTDEVIRLLHWPFLTCFQYTLDEQFAGCADAVATQNHLKLLYNAFKERDRKFPVIVNGLPDLKIFD